MKDAMDSTGVGRAPDHDLYPNRKLIRPSLNRNDHSRHDGEEIHGVIEWYDKYCLKLNRNGASNLLIYKPSIKYMYKESEGKA